MKETTQISDEAKPKNILLFVLGLSPQILTETLYALIHQSVPFIPDEIHVITTQIGAKQCKLALFHEQGGWYHNFCREHNIKGINFTENSIISLTNENGQPIDDIRTPTDNNNAANLITKTIKEFTQQNSILHVSIAGGRKTMSFYAGAALSIFGRARDELSHVLVQAEFEGHSQFYYPTTYPSVIHGRDNKILDKKDVKIELAYLPFIRLRQALDPILIQDEHSFADLVKKLQTNLQQTPNLTIDQINLTLIIDNQQIKFSPINFVFYLWLCKKITQNEVIDMPIDLEPNKIYAKQLLQIISQPQFEMKIHERSQHSLQKTGMELSFITERKNRINTELKKQLGVNAKPYLITQIGDKKQRQQGLTLTKQQLHWL